MPTGAQYPKNIPHSSDGGNLPNNNRDTGSGSKSGPLSRPTGKPRPTQQNGPAAVRSSFNGIPGTQPKAGN